jgi:2-polyprenyl-3-methyl-5-hydroxy-6-metoxy-1,4-benzoquinol methylase
MTGPATTIPPTQEAKIADVWDRHWCGVSDAQLDRLYARLAEPQPWFRQPFVCGPKDELEVLDATVGSLAGKRTLEFGGGIGWTSLWLARAGARTTVADISGKALELSRAVFARAGCRGEWQQRTIFAEPDGREQHDLVFNSGLIEHFHRDDQLRLLANMRALTRPGGHVVAFAPYAGGKLYVWAKRQMERAGTWRFGDEFPLWTMQDLGREVGLEVVDERTSKPGYQWSFVAGLNGSVAKLGQLAQLLTFADATPLWRWCLGDSMLSTVFRRRD